jgi:hypothetical protein
VSDETYNGSRINRRSWECYGRQPSTCFHSHGSILLHLVKPLKYMFMRRLNDCGTELISLANWARSGAADGIPAVRHIEWLISFTYFLRRSVRMSTRGANTNEAKRGGVTQEI